MSVHQDRDSKIYTDIVKSMMVDYVVNDFTQTKLCEKYNLTRNVVTSIFDKHKFREKRLQYQEKVLQKSVDKLATRHSFILSRISNILWHQVERLEKNLRDDPDRLLDSSRMKEVLTAFALLSKEHRLDNGESTDNQTHTIKVEFGSAVPIISDNNIQHQSESDVVEAQSVNVPTVEEIKTVVEEGANIDEDDDIFGSLD